MCHNIKVVNRTKNGIVVACTDCNKYQVLFKNFNFNFSEKEYSSFYNYLKVIDGEGWEEEYKNSIYEKRIPIPTAQQNLIILINLRELYELKKLINIDKTKLVTLLSYKDIEYDFIIN